MSPETAMDRSELEREAELARERLANTLSALDRRRHEVMNVGRRIEQQVLPVAAVGVLALVGVAGVVGAAAYGAAKKRRRKNRSRERMAALRSLWTHPERLGRGPRPRSVLAEAARRTTVAVASYLAVAAVRYLIDHGTSRATSASLQAMNGVGSEREAGEQAAGSATTEADPSHVAARFPSTG